MSATRPPSPYEQLQALMSAEERRELECRDILKHAVDLLVREPFGEFYRDETEVPGNAGRVDYFIACKVGDETVGGDDRVKVWLWEVKAPQCPVFKYEDGNRLCPTLDLVEAENQLIYYYEERKRNPHFREQLAIRYDTDIKLGGVIIGKRESAVRMGNNQIEPGRLGELYTQAVMFRRRYFYTPHGMELLTWDQVLRHLKPRDEHVGETLPD